MQTHRMAQEEMGHFSLRGNLRHSAPATAFLKKWHAAKLKPWKRRCVSIPHSDVAHSTVLFLWFQNTYIFHKNWKSVFHCYQKQLRVFCDTWNASVKKTELVDGGSAKFESKREIPIVEKTQYEWLLKLVSNSDTKCTEIPKANTPRGKYRMNIGDLATKPSMHSTFTGSSRNTCHSTGLSQIRYPARPHEISFN